MNVVNNDTHKLICAITDHYIANWTEEDKSNYIFDRLYDELSELPAALLGNIVTGISAELLRRCEEGHD